ncbi:MAG TPA: tripartite tricarboxylate transporter substrate binding protein [Beijerinckiaceae bacterium]|jgi:tripartite-type tricarboxylate transporter receptor subunit TctC
MRLKAIMGGLAAVATCMAATAAPAQDAADYPNRPIHAYVGYPPGSGADILGRYFSRKLADLTGKTVIVENKPGATSNIALGLAAKAKPDGYTLMYAANSNMAGSQFLFKNLPFDTQKDFLPISQLSQTTFMLVVAPNSPVKSVAELTAMLKSSDKAKYAYTNQTAQIATEFYKTLIDAKVTPVSYRTSADTIPDLAQGAVDFMVIDGTFGSGQVRQGRLRPLAVTTAQRHPGMPDIPTMREAGVTDYDEFASWWTVWAPAGTPRPIIDKLAGWYGQIVRSDETREFLHGIAGTPQIGGPDETAERLKREIVKWGRVAKAAGIEPQ